MSKRTKVGMIGSLERMPSSVNGNPRYRVTFTDGESFPMMPDASASYGLTNRENLENRVRASINGRGHIEYVTIIDPEVPYGYQVTPLRASDVEYAREPMKCGTCLRTWDDAVVTAVTPVPSGRCPFEPFHGGDA